MMGIKRINWLALYGASTGRLSRWQFGLATLPLLILWALFERVRGSAVFEATAWLVQPMLVYMAMAIAAKRLHDRGRSGWWAGLVAIGVIVIAPWPEGIVDLVICLALSWATVELAVLPGEAVFNRFGPRPALALN